jgi:hypothetical protein
MVIILGVFYKHSAPLGLGINLGPFATNIPPRWGWEAIFVRLLQTFRPAGAGKRFLSVCYKHSAPLGLGTNLPRWLQTFRRYEVVCFAP